VTAPRGPGAWLALLLLGAHVWLGPFAHVNPPDPLWMGGIFDDADHDDVVLLVMAITGVVNSRPVLAAPTRSEIWVEAEPQSAYPPILANVHSIRAPPAG